MFNYQIRYCISSIAFVVVAAVVYLGWHSACSQIYQYSSYKLLLTKSQKQLRTTLMWVGILIWILLLALVIIIEAERVDNNVQKFKNQNALASAVMVIFLTGFSLICMHSVVLLKNSKVVEVHSLKAFGPVSVT